MSKVTPPGSYRHCLLALAANTVAALQGEQKKTMSRELSVEEGRHGLERVKKNTLLLCVAHTCAKIFQHIRLLLTRPAELVSKSAAPW
jgi:hypothetical protein